MSKLFVKLTTGVTRTDSSMGNNRKYFDKCEYPMYVRPYMIEAIERITWGNDKVTDVVLSGWDKAINVLETPEEIMAQIETIEKGTNE